MNQTPQPAIRITSNVIGIPSLETPVDQDIDTVVSKSAGQMIIPCLLIQLLREIRHVKERLESIETGKANKPGPAIISGH